MSILKLQDGYPDLIGRRFAFCAPGYTGPVSYPNTGTTIGDPLSLPALNNYIDSCSGHITTDGTYIVFCQPLGIGPRSKWVARWFAFTSSGVGAEATNGTNLSSKTTILSGYGGKY
jgi:hypothetical protein